MDNTLMSTLDADHRRAVENIREAAGRIWARPLHRYYTDHTIAHSERIIALLDGLVSGMMATDKRLSPAEVFVLLAAAYLHDIGMQDERFAGCDLETVRADYQDVTAELIYRSVENPAEGFNLSLLNDPALVEAIGLVAKGHRQTDLSASEYAPLVYGNETLRLQLLAALLRLGDRLDVDYRRVDLEALKLAAAPAESRLHRWTCYYVSGVRVVDEYITIAYRLPKTRPGYRNLIVPLVETNVRAALGALEEILRANSVKVALSKPLVRLMRTMQVMPPELEEQARQDEAVKQARHRAVAEASQDRQRARPIAVLRESTKWVTGPLALALADETGKSLRQRLLTQASKLPSTTYLDMDLLESATADMIRINREARILLGAHRIAPNAGQLEALRQRAKILAEYLIRIYRLKRGDASELDRLAGLPTADGDGKDE